MPIKPPRYIDSHSALGHRSTTPPDTATVRRAVPVGVSPVESRHRGCYFLEGPFPHQSLMPASAGTPGYENLGAHRAHWAMEVSTVQSVYNLPSATLIDRPYVVLSAAANGSPRPSLPWLTPDKSRHRGYICPLWTQSLDSGLLSENTRV